LAAWLLHILCDIPAHAARYFPTPFFWPLPTPLLDVVFALVHGGELRSMFIVYCWIFFYFRRKSS
jgi:hypothetical protein